MRGEKPAPGVLKINSDGCFNPESSDGGWEFVIRDAKGHVVEWWGLELVILTMHKIGGGARN